MLHALFLQNLVFWLPTDSHKETGLGTHSSLLICSVPWSELSLYSEIYSKGAGLKKLHAHKHLKRIAEHAFVDRVEQAP